MEAQAFSDLLGDGDLALGGDPAQHRFTSLRFDFKNTGSEAIGQPVPDLALLQFGVRGGIVSGSR